MRYLMREKWFSIGEDFWIEDEQGRKAFRVDGKVLRIRRTFVLEDPAGAEVATIEKKLASMRAAMNVKRAGQVVATVRKALFAPFRERFDIEVRGAPGLRAQGDITNHEYAVRRGGNLVARISRKWFSIHETYAVDVPDAEDAGLLLALTVAIDQLGHDEDGRR